MTTSDPSFAATLTSHTHVFADSLSLPRSASGEAYAAIAIVSASRLLHEGLTMVLGRYLSAIIAAHYDGELLPDETSNHAQVALLDANLGRYRVFSWLNYWRLHQIPSVVLELPNDPQIIVDHLQAGASDYCLQGTEIADVALAIRNVCEGKTCFAADVTAEICSRLRTLGAPIRETPQELALTPRETEILRCIAKGMSNQEIADSLVIHILTVKHHVHHILKKLNLSRRWDAARFAREAGLMSRRTDEEN